MYCTIAQKCKDQQSLIQYKQGFPRLEADKTGISFEKIVTNFFGEGES
jgi:hypothetical protein